MRWLRAGNDPSRSDYSLQRAECPLVRSELVLGCPFYARGVACVSIRRSLRPSVTFTTEVGARIKFP